MIFLGDESVDYLIIERLRTQGYDVLYVAEMDPGISDEFVLDEANRRNAVLITVDKDFGELVYRQKRLHTGVILLRLSGLSGPDKATITYNAITKHGHEMTRAFTVISGTSIRIRRSLDYS